MEQKLENPKKEIIEFIDEEITKITSSLEDIDSELIEEIRDNQIKDLIKLKINSYDNSINLGKLYFRIFNILKEIKEFLKVNYEDDEGNKQIFDKIYNYIKDLEIDKDFGENIETYNAEIIGSYNAGTRIKHFVSENRKDINILIDLFFRIFKEED
jgi:hypothetical protein